MQNGFYVYEHIRLDTMKPFYVGKGSGTRAYRKDGRNQYWHNVVNKHGYIVNIVAENLDEEMAFLAEIEKIDQLRRIGIALTNMTDGGEGTSGYVFKTEVISRRTASRANLICSEETRKKMSESHKGRESPMHGKKHSSETLSKMVASLVASYADGTRAKKISEALKGRVFSEEHKEKLSFATKKFIAEGKRKPPSDETKRKISAANSGSNNGNYGKPMSEEQKQLLRSALKARPRVTCPHCSKILDESNAKRWHFNNCKHRKD